MRPECAALLLFSTTWPSKENPGCPVGLKNVDCKLVCLGGSFTESRFKGNSNLLLNIEISCYKHQQIYSGKTCKFPLLS